ncbi:MAG TPA: hypothetical protein VF003_07540 [Pseudonocardiaceae bacterium]
MAPASDDLAQMAIPDEFSADEIRAALMLTAAPPRRSSSLTYDLITRLPAVRAATIPSLFVPCDNDLGMWDDAPPERHTGPQPGPAPTPDPTPF